MKFLGTMEEKIEFVRAKIISIGDELLIGQVVNTNAAWLGNILTKNGFKVDAVLTIGDSESEIINALDVCSDGLGLPRTIGRSRLSADILIQSWSLIRRHTITC